MPRYVMFVTELKSAKPGSTGKACDEAAWALIQRCPRTQDTIRVVRFMPARLAGIAPVVVLVSGILRGNLRAQNARSKNNRPSCQVQDCRFKNARMSVQHGSTDQLE